METREVEKDDQVIGNQELDTFEEEENYETVVVEVSADHLEEVEDVIEEETLEFEDEERLEEEEEDVELIEIMEMPSENFDSCIVSYEVMERVNTIKKNHKRKLAALEAEYEQEILGLQSRLQKARKKRPDFKCNICEVTFSAIGSLNKHKKTAKNCKPPDKTTTIKVKDCSTFMTDDGESADEIDKEEIVQNLKKRLKTEIRQMKAEHNEKVLDLEYQIRNAKAPDLKCGKCGAIFTSVGHFNKHTKNSKCNTARKLVISGNDGIEISVEVQKVII